MNGIVKCETKKETTMFLTGFRPKNLKMKDVTNRYSLLQYETAYERLERTLESYIVDQGIDTFITSGAQGFEILGFTAIQRLKRKYPEKNIRHILFMPFRGQDSKWKEKGIFGKTDYRWCVNKSDETHLTSDVSDKDDYKTIVEAIDANNKLMIEHAGICLFAQFEDEPMEQAKGGLAKTFQFAQEKCRVDLFSYRINEKDQVI